MRFKPVLLILLPVLLCSLSCTTIQRSLGGGNKESVTINEGPEDDELSELLGESDSSNDEGDDIDSLLSGESAEPSPPPPPPPEDRYRVITDQARLRSGPSTAANIIDVLRKGTQLKMIDWDGNWVRVVDDQGRGGFIHVTLIERVDDDFTEPVEHHPMGTDEVETSFSPCLDLVVLKGSNIRRGPGTSYDPPIMAVPAGSAFTASGKTGQWYYGSCCGMNGWIHQNLASNSLDPPAATGADTSAGNAPGGPQPTVDRSPAPSTRSTAPVSTTPMITGDQPVTVRSAPSLLSQALGKLNPGQQITILESRSGWHKVKAGRLEGWVAAGSITGVAE